MMTWLQLISLAGIMGTFLGIGIAVAAYFNGKHIKESTDKIIELIRKIKELIEKMDERAEQRQGEVLAKL